VYQYQKSLTIMKPDTFTAFRNFDKECIRPNYLNDTETELTMLARYS